MRSRASSAASSGLDTSQVHHLLNTRDSSSNNFTTTSNGKPPFPTSTTSSIRRDSEAVKARTMSESRKDDKFPPRKATNIIMVKPRVENSLIYNDRSADAVLMTNEPEAKNGEQHKTIERNLTEPNLTLATTLYHNDTVWQIDDLVFVGGIEANCSMNLHCRLNITIFVDLTNDPDRRDNKIPCLCGKPIRHSRYNYEIELPRTNDVDWVNEKGESVSMTDLFESFVRLTEKATNERTKVLVFCNDGRNEAPAFAAAYLLNKHRISRVAAVNQVLLATKSMCPAVNISDNLQRCLKRYQIYKGIEVDQAQQDNDYTYKLFQAPKLAWP